MSPEKLALSLEIMRGLRVAARWEVPIVVVNKTMGNAVLVVSAIINALEIEASAKETAEALGEALQARMLPQGIEWALRATYCSHAKPAARAEQLRELRRMRQWCSERAEDYRIKRLREKFLPQKSQAWYRATELQDLYRCHAELLGQLYALYIEGVLKLDGQPRP